MIPNRTYPTHVPRLPCCRVAAPYYMRPLCPYTVPSTQAQRMPYPTCHTLLNMLMRTVLKILHERKGVCAERVSGHVSSPIQVSLPYAQGSTQGWSSNQGNNST